jgi:hypothetical protein
MDKPNNAEGFDLPKFLVANAAFHLVGACSCLGGPPLLLTLIPGAPKSTTCPACKTIYRAVLVGYDEKDPNAIQFGISTKHPDVIIPHSGLKVV